MPPTKHMTGDVFRGYLLDGFFNLAGALTGQGILLVGMMTEAVVTPWLSDRDLALRNVRYVLNAAGNLAEDFARRRAASSTPGPDTVLREAVDLLGRIADRRADPGDRRRHVRHHQAAGGRRQGPGRRRRARPDAYNPALELLEKGSPVPQWTSARWRTRGPMVFGERHPTIVRPYGDTTGDGMVQMSFTLPVPAGPRAEGAALQLATRWASSRRWSCTATPSTPATRSSSSTAACNHLVDLDAVARGGARLPAAVVAEINGAIKQALHRKLVVLGACIGTDAHTVGIDAILNVKGFAGEKGLEYYREMR